MVGLPPAGDVHVGLGAGGAGVDAASRSLEGRALDGVAGDRIGVIEPDIGAATWTGMLVDEALGERDETDAFEEIGRASCRERVCQYVSISVVAVSLKNKKKQ